MSRTGLFRVKQGDARSSLFSVYNGVPQVSTLDSMTYNIYTLPTTADIIIATYADGIALLAIDENPILISEKLQQLPDTTSLNFRTASQAVKMVDLIHQSILAKGAKQHSKEYC